ncbi:hypothetical protein Hden_1565 [Hyphomicrobium denitrificans ATCC 51888]|uniref:Uncharacterized protein n=1 Tax=Hyphomicrobium denitrificans (strain ATCC 51888 / DSM 1869 / NCIMB 11706 / TK 0415) TaxID=582899 RepID=D8JQ51_HYPDA|nr:hypothetical protein Hden_0145 [Hyphomicrobium denitrificans ATCC 51888]ADJ23377.1 hypothetical protein Hden_1565 [Hyphomicrobium denitrificans ATCC 51888]
MSGLSLLLVFVTASPVLILGAVVVLSLFVETMIEGSIGK